MTKPWCALPFVHMFASDPEHDDKVCCIATKSIKDYANTPDTWLEDKWTGEYMVDLRKRMLTEGSEFPECQECIQAEKFNDKSDRMIFNDMYLEHLVPNVDTGNQHDVPIYWDLRPGNLCNLKCRMCGPTSSTQLNKELKNTVELKELYDSKDDYDFHLNIEDGCNWASEQNISYIEKALHHTDRIKFLGGEPTIMPEVARLMDYMIDNGVSVDLDNLNITTNGTNVNPKFYEKLSKFKKVKITLSLDGVNETVEYIRHPLDFTSFTNNFEKLGNISSVDVSFNCAVQALNLHNMTDFIEWLVEKSENRDTSVNFVKVTYPVGSSLSALPQEYRDYYCNKILLHPLMNHDIIEHSNLRSVVERIRDERFNQSHYNDLVTQTVLFDVARNQHIKNYIPELWDVISLDYKGYQRDVKMDTDNTKIRKQWVLHDK